MSTRKELINLTIINNSDCKLTIPLFQNNVASINATTKYSWDITTADLSCGFGSIIINSGNTVLVNVALFSIDGKMLYNNNNVNSNELLIQNLYVNNQPMIVKAISDNGNIVSKKWLY
jgi:hypothetical protein